MASLRSTSSSAGSTRSSRMRNTPSCSTIAVCGCGEPNVKGSLPVRTRRIAASRPSGATGAMDRHYTSSMELPHDLFEACLSPTDSSTPVRFQAAITKAAGSLHVEACSPIDIEEYEELGHCKR